MPCYLSNDRLLDSRVSTLRHHENEKFHTLAILSRKAEGNVGIGPGYFKIKKDTCRKVLKASSRFY
jgi:hypothetical protein